MISIFETIAYDEDEKISHPALYKTHRLCEHFEIKGIVKVKNFLNKFNLTLTLLNEQISFSVLWNLPRREYGETKMWVCLSGETHNGVAPFKHFTIANNYANDESQDKAIEIIKYMNKL